MNGEKINVSFYTEELLKPNQGLFRIDKVIRGDYRRKQAFLKWKGYSDDFNSWIPMKDLQNLPKHIHGTLSTFKCTKKYTKNIAQSNMHSIWENMKRDKEVYR